MPEIKGAVRGEIILAGWIFKEVETNRTNAIYVVGTDPKGSIP